MTCPGRNLAPQYGSQQPEYYERRKQLATIMRRQVNGKMLCFEPDQVGPIINRMATYRVDLHFGRA
jgi:hypothetical protein